VSYPCRTDEHPVARPGTPGVDDLSVEVSRVGARRIGVVARMAYRPAAHQPGSTDEAAYGTCRTRKWLAATG